MNANQVVELDMSVSLMRDYMRRRPLSSVDLTEDDVPVREESVEVVVPRSMSPMWDHGATSRASSSNPVQFRTWGNLLVPISDVTINLDCDVVITQAIEQFEDLGNTLGASEVIQDLRDEEAAQVLGEGTYGFWAEDMIVNIEEKVCFF